MPKTKEEKAKDAAIMDLFDKDVEMVQQADLKIIIEHMREMRAKFIEEENAPKRKTKKEKGDMMETSAADAKK